MSKLRMMVIGIVSLASMGVMAASANAATVTVAPGGAITATAASTLTLSPGRLNIACNLTFNASINAGPIVAPLNTLAAIGRVTGGTNGTCSGGATLSLLNPSTWSLNGSVATTGRGVPARLEIVGAAFQVTIGSLACLYSGSAYADLNAAGNTLTFNAANTIPFSSGGILCPRPGTLSGTMAVSPAQTVTAV